MRFRDEVFFLFLVSFQLAAGSFVNKTIDDADPSLRYFGANWNAVTASNVALCCAYALDPSKMFNGTWHDGAVGSQEGAMSISLTFSGVAIYVYFALISNTSDLTKIDFTLDGDATGPYLHNASNFGGQNAYPEFTYNQNIFSKQSLANTNHTLNLTLADTGDGVTANVAFFDYIIVTEEVVVPLPLTTTKPAAVTSSLVAELKSSPTVGQGRSSSVGLKPSTTVVLRPSSTAGRSYSTVAPTPSTAVESTPDASPPISASSRHPSNELVVGGVIGALSGLVLLVALLIRFIRKYRAGVSIDRDYIFPRGAMAITPFDATQPTPMHSRTNLTTAMEGEAQERVESPFGKLDQVRRGIELYVAKTSQQTAESQGTSTSGVSPSEAGTSEAGASDISRRELATLKVQVGQLVQQTSSPPPDYHSST